MRATRGGELVVDKGIDVVRNVSNRWTQYPKYASETLHKMKWIATKIIYKCIQQISCGNFAWDVTLDINLLRQFKWKLKYIVKKCQ